LVNIIASALGTIVGMRLYGNAGVAIATGVLTFVILIFAEVMPKTIAALYPQQVAFPSSILLRPLSKICLPVVWGFNAITLILMRCIGIRGTVIRSDAVSKEELKTIVNESKGKLSRRNQDMLISILDLDKVSVDEIMVPRTEIIGIDINDDWKSILRQLTHSPHGRIVLYRDSLDDAIGMLRVREAYRLMIEKREFTKQMLIKAADKIYFVPDSTPLNLQLVNFQRNNEKVGLVVDEYGDIQGLISVEDILEEIVGDFTTSMSPSLAEEVRQLPDGTMLIEGTTNIREINKALGLSLPEEGARTINGLLLEELGDIPQLNTKVKIGRYQFEVTAIGENVIKTVKVTPLAHLEANIAADI
ncbi:MAG: CNNM domain-containing protein, partial [Morganella sp. (in: enterobacteria)]